MNETKLSKAIIKKAEELIPDDTGYIDSLETLIDCAKMSTYYEWIDELCKKHKIDCNELHYIISLNCGGGFESYFEKVIVFLSVSKNATIENVDNFLLSGSENKKQLT